MTIEITDTTGAASAVDGAQGAATPGADGGDAAIMAAARAALGVDAAPAADAGAVAPATGATPAAAAAPVAPEMTELEKIRAEIRAKDQEQKQRERLGAEYDAKFQKALADAKAELRAQAQKEARDELHARLRTAPREALDDLKVDGIAMVRDIAAHAGNPAMAEVAKMRAEFQAKIDALVADKAKGEEAAQAAHAKAVADARAHEAAQASRHLMTIVAEKVPAALHFYGSEGAISAKAQSIADEYCAAKRVDTCPYAVIVQEIESEARKGAAERVKALQTQLDAVSKLQQQPAGVAAKQPTELNGRNPGTRTLSAQSASERRASPKPVSEMTATEFDEAARAAAREAMGPTIINRMG